MIPGLFFQFGSFYGGGIGSILSYWEQLGFFSYALPFLLIFAIVYGILTRTKIFDNNAVNGILALVVGLLSLQFDFVPVFFSEIFPRVGVGLSVILALLILAGLFFDPDSKHLNWMLLGVGFIIFLIVIFQTFDWVGWYPGFWLYDLLYNWPGVLALLIFLGIVGAIISSNKSGRNLPDYQGAWAKPLMVVPGKTR